MFCYQCGNEIPESHYFCPKCGAQQAGTQTAQTAQAAGGTQAHYQQTPPVEPPPIILPGQVPQIEPGPVFTEERPSHTLAIVLGIVGGFFAVIVILVLLLAIPVYNNSRSNAQKRTCQANQRTVDGAIQSYQAGDVSSRYPDSLETMTEPGNQTLKKVPTCPSGKEYIWTTSPDGTDPPSISCTVHPAQDGY